MVQYPGLPGSASRYGHTMVLDPFSSSVVVFGGYNGVLLGDVFRLYLGECCVAGMVVGKDTGGIIKVVVTEDRVGKGSSLLKLLILKAYLQFLKLAYINSICNGVSPYSRRLELCYVYQNVLGCRGSYL